MYKILRADKDTYITNKIVAGERKTTSNVGDAGTLDLFKIYGASSSGTIPNLELSRIMIHFDLESIKSLTDKGDIDPGDPSFWCKIHLRDVYGGQPTPSNFTVSVFPLSASFKEGIGRDSAYFTDYDTSNWLSSSVGTAWFVSGCSRATDTSTAGDYITSSVSLITTKATQKFSKGTEDLLIDVTPLVSATLSGELPDSGFRISFENSLEDDSQTYFVKRFASRSAYDESKRPRLLVGFDDSITDDTQNLTFDSPCQLVLYNYAGGSLVNLTSGSSLSPVVGNNCLVLKLTTQVSGGYYDLLFSGSQYSLGANYVTGTYVASVTLSTTDVNLTSKLNASSSIKFVPTWMSQDGNQVYVTGSTLSVSKPDRSSVRPVKKYVVSVQGLNETYDSNSEVLVRVHVFDYTNPLVTVTRLPVELPGIVVRDAFYQIRDAVTGDTAIPFDVDKNSTKISSDSKGMFFKLDTSDLTPGRTYTVDVMTIVNGVKTKYNDVSPVFRVESKE